MLRKTTEFSFILKPSPHGIGVFAVHDIARGTPLRLFPGRKGGGYKVRTKKEVPETFRKYFIDRGETLSGPNDLGCMEIGWHLNHSADPNARHRDYEYYALRDINAGEEITIHYNSLEEPEEAKEDYYR
jgi:hypothetical protein